MTVEKITREQRNEVISAMIAQLEDLGDMMKPEGPEEDAAYVKLVEEIADDVITSVKRHLRAHLVQP